MNRGFTLIEMVVATAIFVLVMTAASGLLVSGLRGQRQSLAHQQVLSQTSYLMEYMSRAVRMARKDMAGTCTGTPKLNYAFSGQCLKFINYKNQCQQFCLEDGRLKNENGVYLTSGDLQINSFNVSLSGQTQDDDLQPKATIFLDIVGQEMTNIKIQSTVSQRNLDVRK